MKNKFAIIGLGQFGMAIAKTLSKKGAEVIAIDKDINKIEEDLKASADVFTIDPIKYKISEKIKKSFDPKRIFNPGKMYTGI